MYDFIYYISYNIAKSNRHDKSCFLKVGYGILKAKKQSLLHPEET